MSEKQPSFAYLNRHELVAEEFIFSLKLARDALELRSKFTAIKPDLYCMDIDKDRAVEIAEAAVGTLWRLGLDMNDTDDDRVSGVLKGAEVIKQADNFGPKRPHPTNRPETPFWSNYQRLLSGLDVTLPDRLQLKPQEYLIKKPLLFEVAAAALAFTSGSEFTVPHRYGRKASRTIDDPASKYWGVSVHTDTFPGTQIGSSYMQGPNISVSMPTGLFTAKSLKGLGSAYNTSNPVWKETLENGYVEPFITVQNIHLGNQHVYQDNVDTRSGVVRDFLDYAKEA